eukprot:scaffold11365_cov78-Skeletonema_dohrnii-CCMP3373.AAC.2
MSPSQRNNNKTIDTANEEWPEIQTLVSRLAPEAPTPQEVNVNNSLSAQDLKSLKKKDPFLYYSIPGVRDATVRLERDVDMHQIAQNGLKRHCQSCPAKMQTSSISEPVAKVKRCTRVSFECHTDLLLDLDDMSDDLGDMGKALEKYSLEDDSCEDFLFKLLERTIYQLLLLVLPVDRIYLLRIHLSTALALGLPHMLGSHYGVAQDVMSYNSERKCPHALQSMQKMP